jgi:hypothetical protein
MRVLIFVLMLCLTIAPLTHAGLEFDSTDDVVNLGTEAGLEGLSVFTICAWIRPNSGFSTNFPMIFSHYNASLNGWDFYVVYNAGGYGLATSWGHTSGGYSYAEITTAEMSFDAWHHVCAIQNGNNHTAVKLYIDGVDKTASINSTNSDGTRDSDAGVSFFIGNYYDSSETFVGIVSDIRLYNRVLSTAEVGTLYNSRLRGAGILGSGLIGYWPLDDGESGTACNGDAVSERIANRGGTGDDGANNTGCTWRGETIIRRPAPIE